MTTDRREIDDCFRHGQQLLRHDEAVALLKSRLRPVSKPETVPLAAAGGRIICQDVIAGIPVPGHTNSAVDGYAFRYGDYDPAKGVDLAVSGRASAGHPIAAAVAPGHAVRILTGAVVPAGLDSVAMQEDCVLRGDAAGAGVVSIPPGLKAGINVRHAGEDVAVGTVLFSEGHLLRPQDLAALASVGVGTVGCYSALKVAIVSTGDEVIRAGEQPLRPGEVYDANAPMLTMLSLGAGAMVEDLGIWPDDRHEVQRRLAELSDRYDVVLTSGGASKGSEDHMAASIGALGTRHFWEIAVKPGRPMMLGQLGRTIVVGLPGNPVAVFVCFLMYVYPMLRRLGGAPWLDPRRYSLPATFSVPKRKLGRREYWRGMLVKSDQGLAVDKFARDGSGLISGLTAADGLIECLEDRPSVSRGEMIDFIPFGELGIRVR